jgi:hypothetical protein
VKEHGGEAKRLLEEATGCPVHCISAATGEGIEELVYAMRRKL